jgi:predicted RNA-binding Zn ribbon-like protein
MVRYAYEVNGLRLPARLAGHPALDFCNTAAGWGEPERKEYLASYRHLVVWARESGLVGADAAGGLSRGAGADVLERALRLREALYGILLGGARAEDWDTVAREVERAAAAARFSAPGRWTLPETEEQPLLAVARAAGDLLASTEPRLVRACPGRGCGWLFLDSRGRRRWCDMAVCGNRAKARRHAARESSRRTSAPRASS